MTIYKVDKRKTRSEIKHLEIIFELTQKIEKEEKRFHGWCHGEKVEEIKKSLEQLKKQLECKHEICEKEEWTNGHNGEINIKIKCTNCGFITERN
jgi:guanylate kinase